MNFFRIVKFLNFFLVVFVLIFAENMLYFSIILFSDVGVFGIYFNQTIILKGEDFLKFIKKAFTVLFCDGNRSFVSRLLTCLAVNLGLVFSVFMFIPMETYLGNTTEFIFSFGSLMSVILIITVPMFLLMTFVEMLFKGILFRIVTSVVFGVTLASYVQSMFLNGMMKSLDGSYESYTMAQKLINLAIWLIVFIAPVVISIFWKSISKNINKFVSLAVVAMQFIAIFSLILTYQPNTPEALPTYEGIYDLSSEKNVIVLVIDRFDNENIDKILENDPDYFDKLGGFTYYPNTVGSYVYTQNVLPYLISGVENPDLYISTEEKANNIENSQYLKSIDDLTDSIGIYTEQKFVETSAENITDLVNNIKSSQPSLDFKTAYKPIIKCALYRVAPLMFKSRFNYTSSEFNTAVKIDSGDSVYHCESHLYDSIFMESIKNDGLQISGDQGKTGFKLIHFQGAHFPYNLTATGEYSETPTDRITVSYGSFSIIFEYIDCLKKLGVYEDTAIIITSDHGETSLLASVDENIKPNTNPILFYKPSGVGADTPFKESFAPISHKNLFPTVISELGGDYSFTGSKPITDVREDENIVREFYWSIQDPNVSTPNYIPHKYEINGDCRDPENWKYIGPYTE